MLLAYRRTLLLLSLLAPLLVHLDGRGQGQNPLVGVWSMDEGFQITELLLRSDGRYQWNTRNTDPNSGFPLSEQGRYQVDGQNLVLTPYYYVGAPEGVVHEYHLSGNTLVLIRREFEITREFQYVPGSREDVLAKENVDRDPIGKWRRTITFWGDEEYTFRPGGYYIIKSTPEGGQFPPEFIRGRYSHDGVELRITPYSGTEAVYEIDYFGDTLTIIRREEFSGDSYTFTEVPGSEAEVLARSAEAEAFLARENWQVGVWELRDGHEIVDLTFRPDGFYIATTHTEILKGTVRGRYTLEPRRIHLHPFIGQDQYSGSNGEFGKGGRTRELDFYEGELQFIDLQALSQSVTIARKVEGSDQIVNQKTLEAQAEREKSQWYVGKWVVNDPTGWMEFVFRPDYRYIAQSGTDGVAGRVERGQYVINPGKLTLAPYSGQGPARGFELDLYNGDLFLVGDSRRLVIARKEAGSEAEVTEKTLDPVSLKGERGDILGRWTAHMPGQNVELVFRHDGEFRLTRCTDGSISLDYGLYSVDMEARRLVYDSRFVVVQNQGLDFYGNTMTIYGGLGAPKSFMANIGSVDAAIEASFAADDAEAEIDAQWLARVPIGPRDPNAVHVPVGDIPADPNPGRIFQSPAVLKNYQLYRRLIPGFVYFNEWGTIKSVAVLNTREWHFFPTGRVLVRFKNYYAGPSYPITVAEVSDSWGAYRIEPRSELRDILHIYADNGVFIEMDIGEQMEMTLEDGRRHLFWEKDYQILSEWAAENQTVPCTLPENPDASLMNTGLDLSTAIDPDPIAGTGKLRIGITRSASGNLVVSGTIDGAAELVTERVGSFGPSVTWQAVQTNSVVGGAFSFEVPRGDGDQAYFRVRRQ